MMTAVTGDRGVGKTYFLSKMGFRAAKRKAVVITNFQFAYGNIDTSREPTEYLFYLLAELGRFKQAGFQMVDFDPRFPSSEIFVLIDEAHLLLSAHKYKQYATDPALAELIIFLAQMRKTDSQLFYSCQYPRQIDKTMRTNTEETIRFTPLIRFRYKKKVYIQRPPDPITGELPPKYFQREIRYPIPIFREEHHKLDADNPDFDYTVVTDPETGQITLAPKSTLLYWYPRLSGWMDPFYYSLYDHNQMINVADIQVSEFPYLEKFSITPPMQKPILPTFEKLFGLDTKIPPKYVNNKSNLQLHKPHNTSTVKIDQPMKFLDELKFYNDNGFSLRRWTLRPLRGGSERKPPARGGLASPLLYLTKKYKEFEDKIVGKD